MRGAIEERDATVRSADRDGSAHDSGTSWRRAIAATSAMYAGGSGWAIECAWVFSSVTSPVRASSLAR